MSNYYMILTSVGIAKLINATLTSVPLDITQMAVGDSGGSHYSPTQSATALKNEVWRGTVHLVEQSTDNPNWIVVEAVIPTTVGGFTARELGLIDAEGDLIAIGKIPETYKPIMEEGSAKDLYLKAIIEASNASSVVMKVDPSSVIANRKYVDDKIQIVSTNLTSLETRVTEHLDNYGEYYVRARSTLAQSIPTSTWTDIVFNMHDNNHAGMFTPSNASTEITIVKTGIYLIVGNISYSFATTNAVGGIRVLYNNVDVLGSTVAHLQQDRPFDLNVVAMARLGAGEKIKLQAYQTTGNALNSVVGSKSVPQFSVKKVG